MPRREYIRRNRQHGFTEDGTKRIVSAVRRLESRPIFPERFHHGHGVFPVTEEGCWAKLTDKTEVVDAAAQEGVVGAFDWKLMLVDTEGNFYLDPRGFKGQYSTDPDKDMAAYEVNNSNANLHLAGNNIVRLRPGRRPGKGGIQLLFDKGLTDEPDSLRVEV